MAILLELFEENISKFLSSLGLATREDVEIIEDRLGRMEERLTDVKTEYKKAGVGPAAAKKAAPTRDISSATKARKPKAQPKPKAKATTKTATKTATKTKASRA